jgi:hypothetical protein
MNFGDNIAIAKFRPGAVAATLHQKSRSARDRAGLLSDANALTVLSAVGGNSKPHSASSCDSLKRHGDGNTAVCRRRMLMTDCLAPPIGDDRVGDDRVGDGKPGVNQV